MKASEVREMSIADLRELSPGYDEDKPYYLSIRGYV